jgi:hypothetical protein
MTLFRRTISLGTGGNLFRACFWSFFAVATTHIAGFFAIQRFVQWYLRGSSPFDPHPLLSLSFQAYEWPSTLTDRYAFSPSASPGELLQALIIDAYIWGGAASIIAGLVYWWLSKTRR